MKHTIGHFLLQPNKDFPVDCEMFDDLQTNMAILSVLGNVAGDKAILNGCDRIDATHRAPGFVFVRTKSFPQGEVLYWEGGSTPGGMYLKEETVSVSALGFDYPQAYVQRSLAPGIGEENFGWNDFREIKTNPQLDDEIRSQNGKIAELSPTPLGIVDLWAGKVDAIPTDKYRLCDGSSLPVSEFPELYGVLGNLHGGISGSTFCLPDLRSRFVVGYNGADTDYNAIAKRGGERTHILTVAEMPSHAHGLFLEPHGTRFTGGGKANELNSGSGSTSAAGGGGAHENRPPYYTLAYIMRVR